jgi:tetratricopeptide (TPR) repeat protein
MGLTTRLAIFSSVLLTISSAVALFTTGPFSDDENNPATAQPATSSTDAIIARLEAVVADDAGDFESHVSLGFAYFQKARETGDPAWYASSENAYDAALSLQPGSAEALTGLSALAAARHDFETALAFAQQAPPGDADTQAVLGDALVELGRYDEAFAAYDAAADFRPDLASYTRIAYSRELIGDRDGAIEAMLLAVDSAGPSGEAAAWTRYQLGNLYFNGGDLDSAREEYERSGEALPGYIHALAGTARVHAAEGDYDGSIEIYEGIVARQPVLEYVVALGETYRAAGDGGKEASQMQLARAIGQLYEANGVKTDLESALFEANHGDPATAVTLARAAYEARPSIHAADALAWALYQAGQPGEALAYSEEALRLGTQNALFEYHAGMIHSALGDTEAATKHLQAAVDINPHFSLLYAEEAVSLLGAHADVLHR